MFGFRVFVFSCLVFAFSRFAAGIPGAEPHISYAQVVSQQHVFVPKHVTISQKIRLALLVSIPLALLISSEVLSCAHRADMSLDMLEKCQVVPVRIPSLFQQNVLKAAGRTQVEGSCKVYAGKTNWKTN